MPLENWPPTLAELLWHLSCEHPLVLLVDHFVYVSKNAYPFSLPDTSFVRPTNKFIQPPTCQTEVQFLCFSYCFICIYYHNNHSLSSRRCFLTAHIAHSFLVSISGGYCASQEISLLLLALKSSTLKLSVKSWVCIEMLVWDASKK